ncbi:MAG: ACT domain-containing protein [Clostridia bacterium]|nr:ACT domain-containing protein [Clostridia bacterium]
MSDIVLSDNFCFIAKTDEEISVVCSTENLPQNATHISYGWKAFRIVGELDFSLVGMLSDISNILAKNKISIFALSTFNTDYILVKSEQYEQALKILEGSEYNIID